MINFFSLSTYLQAKKKQQQEEQQQYQDPSEQQQEEQQQYQDPSEQQQEEEQRSQDPSEQQQEEQQQSQKATSKKVSGKRFIDIDEVITSESGPTAPIRLRVMPRRGVSSTTPAAPTDPAVKKKSNAKTNKRAKCTSDLANSSSEDSDDEFFFPTNKSKKTNTASKIKVNILISSSNYSIC